jgi:hypothetical protein
MKLHLGNILYFVFRMIPFIIITYFLISAIFLQDFKALIFLAGAAMATFAAIMAGYLVRGSTLFPFVPNFSKTGVPNSKSMCHVIPLYDTGIASRLPLSTVIYIYTLCYLAIPINNYGRQMTNLPTLVVLPILAFLDMAWLYNFGCSSAVNIFGAGLVGMIVGLLWSSIIFSTNLRQVQYFSILSTNELCSLPSRITYKCGNPITTPPTISNTSNSYTSNSYTSNSNTLNISSSGL